MQRIRVYARNGSLREPVGYSYGATDLQVPRRVRFSFSSGFMSLPLSAIESQASENAAFSALASAIDQAIQSAESNPALAQRTLLALHDEAVALGARRVAARALLHMARIARRTSSIDEAQRLAYRALDELRDLSDPEGESEAVSLIAGAWAMVGELIEARRMFELGLERARAENLPGSIGLLLVDLWGHAAGDAVLVAVAGALRAELPAWATVARIGGEEFVAVVPDLNLERGLELAERVRQRLAAVQVERPEGVISTTVSVGVVEAALDKSFEWSMELADRCCYRAKELGRDRICSVADLLEPSAG